MAAAGLGSELGPLRGRSPQVAAPRKCGYPGAATSPLIPGSPNAGRAPRQLSRVKQFCFVGSWHLIKNPPANAGDPGDKVPSLVCEDLLEEGTATYSSILAWRIPWTQEPGGLQSTGPQTILKRLCTHARICGLLCCC